MLNRAPPPVPVLGAGASPGELVSDADEPGEADPKPSESDRPLAFRLPLPRDDGGGGAGEAQEADGVRAAVEA